MTDMMNMAINDMELDNVTGGAMRTSEKAPASRAKSSQSSTTARRSKRPATRSRRTATYGMRSRLRTDLTTRGSRAA